MQRHPVCRTAGKKIREAKDRTRLGAFLDREFDGVAGLVREFPLLASSANRERCLVIEHAGEIIAHAAWRPLTLCSGHERLEAAGIGLVTTAKAWRGNRLASRLVAACLDRAREAGREIALLFAPERSLYTRLGFISAGCERVTRIRPTSTPLGGKIRPGTLSDVPDLLDMYRQHRLRVERSVAEFQALLAIPDTHCHVLEHAGRIAAYCVEGKGRDLRGVVHEWAGEPDALVQLIPQLAAQTPEPLHLLSPASETPAIEGISTLQAPFQVCILESARFGADDPVLLFGDPSHRPRFPIYLWGLDSV